MIKKGQIIKIISGFFDVKTNENQIYRLRASGTLRDINQIPIVGDYVDFRDDKILIKIYPRKNSLIRPKVSNIDQLAILMSLNEPSFSSLLLDKFLAIIQFQNIDTLIIFTKSDLGNINHYLEYTKQGFKTLLINNKNKNEDWKKINEMFFENKLTVFTGQSGVGKTSLLNNLLNLTNPTNEISKTLGRGKHTTRVVEIFSKNKINIIDTPGFGSINVNLTKNELSKSYFDFKIWSKKCKFNSCLHDKEENCEVKKNYENGILLKSRYENYIKILKEAKNG